MNFQQSFYIGFLFLFIRCIDPINFDISNPPKLLVVDGSFTDFSGNHSLRLWQTSEFGLADTPLTDASVSIFDNEGNEGQYFDMGEGQYLLPESAFPKGKSGTTYFIEIRLGDGKIYKSEPETMPSLVEADSAYFQIEKEPFLNEETGIILFNDVIQLYIDTPIPQDLEDIYLRWQVEDIWSFSTVAHLSETGMYVGERTCYFSDGLVDPQKIISFSNANLKTDRLTQWNVATRQPRPNYKYLGVHFFSVYQQSLTQEAHEYFEDLNQVANLQGSIFDPIPAAVVGNISNINNPNEQVLGYFYVAAVDTVWEATRPPTLSPPLTLAPYCIGRAFGRIFSSDPIECVSCNFEGQTAVARPYFWSFQ